MVAFPPPNICEDVPSLPDEQVEFVLDARAGLLDEAAPGGDALIVTNRRVARVGSGHGSRVLTLLPLSSVSAVEALDAGRSLERLGQGVLLIAVGLALGGGSWVVLGVQVLSVLLGGLPALAGVYALAGWAFPDAEGQLRIHAFGQVVTQPLRSSAARRDAPAAAARLYALTWSDALASAVKLIEAAASVADAEDTDAAQEYAAQAAASVADAEDPDIAQEGTAQAAANGVAEEQAQGAQSVEDGVAADMEQDAVASSYDAARADSIWERIRGSSAR